MFWQPAYVFGFIAGIYNIQLCKVLSNTVIKIIGIIFTIIMVWLSWKYWRDEGLVFVTPLVVISFKVIGLHLPNIVFSFLGKLGEKSLFMWLTHSFYCYHLAKNFIYYPQYTILILINLTIVSYITAVFLEKLMFLIDMKR